jgi:hypothetical protein
MYLSVAMKRGFLSWSNEVKMSVLNGVRKKRKLGCKADKFIETVKLLLGDVHEIPDWDTMHYEERDKSNKYWVKRGIRQDMRRECNLDAPDVWMIDILEASIPLGYLKVGEIVPEKLLANIRGCFERYIDGVYKVGNSNKPRRLVD